MNFLKNKWNITLILILIISSICLFPTLLNGIVNYDDDTVIFQNTLIKNFKFSDIFQLFKQGVGGNYHPLTVISFILNYKLSGESPFSYHLINLILHLINTGLVFLFIKKLTNSNFKISLVTALFFGIHPMHVESIAWVVERKDVLFTCFYLSSILFYLSYNKTKSLKDYFLFTLLGIFSLLSKPAAVTLPVILIAIDYFQNNTISLKNVINKLPLFICSFLLGITTILVQKDYAIGELGEFSILERISYGCYALTNYIIKGIIPYGFSVMHPYPQSTTIWAIKLITATIFVAVILFFIIKKRITNKYIVFGSVFFVANLILVLQFFSIGRAITSERYTYLPYIGLFFIIGYAWDYALKKRKLYNTATTAFLISLAIYCSFSTWHQSKIWKSSETLWSKAIEEYPNDWYAYIGRGNFYSNNNELKKSIKDYSQAISFNPNNFQNYFNRGDSYKKLNQHQKAIADYNTAIEINPNYAKAYINRGQFLYELQKFDEALSDFNKAIQLDQTIPQAYINRGNIHLVKNNYKDALKDYTKSISLNDNLYEAWYNRGNLWLNSKNYTNAISNFKKANSIAPDKVNAYNNLANAYFQNNELDNAINTYTDMIHLFPAFIDGWYNRSIVYFQLGEKENALKDVMKSKSLGKKIPQSYLEQLTN
ncbi:MAG: tetratricopeptide repeat protein [Algibacter sp.]